MRQGVVRPGLPPSNVYHSDRSFARNAIYEEVNKEVDKEVYEEVEELYLKPRSTGSKEKLRVNLDGNNINSKQKQLDR